MRKGLNISSFFVLNAKGEKVFDQSKRTAPPPYFLKTFYLSNWYYCICKNSLDS
jgi:hypothetical protein